MCEEEGVLAARRAWKGQKESGKVGEEAEGGVGSTGLWWSGWVGHLEMDAGDVQGPDSWLRTDGVGCASDT